MKFDTENIMLLTLEILEACKIQKTKKNAHLHTCTPAHLHMEADLDDRLFIDKRASASSSFAGFALLGELHDEPRDSIFKLDPEIFKVGAGEGSYFEVPTFTERMHGWNDDTDITSSLVALPAFIMHSINGMRLAKLLIYTSAAISQDSTEEVTHILNPVVDLSMEFVKLARAFDQDLCSNVKIIIEILGRISNWWKVRITESRIGEDMSKVVTLNIMDRLHKKLARVASNADNVPPQEAEFHNHMWWLVGQIMSAFLSSTTRMMAAANAMVCTYLTSFPPVGHEDDETTRKLWKFAWDANMYYLTTSGMSMTTECQYRGLGKIDDSTVMMPIFDGTLTRELEAAVRYRLMFDTHPHEFKAKTRMVTSAALRVFDNSGQVEPDMVFPEIGPGTAGARAAAAGGGGGGGGGEVGRAAGCVDVEEVNFESLHLRETREETAYEFCRKVFTLFVIRGQVLREMEENVGNVYLPPVRWDTVFCTRNISKQALTIDMSRPPEWLPLFVRFSQGGFVHTLNPSRIPYKCGVFNTGHYVEILRVGQWKTTGSTSKRKHKRTEVKVVKVQVRTTVVNPVFWGAFGVVSI